MIANIKNYAIFGGITLLAGLSLLALNKQQGQKQINRDVFISILKELKNEYYYIWEQMVDCGKQQLMNVYRRKQQNPEEVLQKLVEATFKSEIEEIEETIFKKYNVTRQDVVNANTIYQKDPEVQELRQYIEQGFKQALKMELNMKENRNIPKELSQETILHIQKQIFYESVKLFNKKVKQFAEKQVKVQNDSYEFRTIMQEMREENIRIQILRKNNLHNLEDASTKIFKDALMIYSEEPQFKKQLILLSEKYNDIMQQILNRSGISDDEITFD